MPMGTETPVSNVTCISADSHVVEPGDLWLNYIESRFKERAPRLIDYGDHEAYECEGKELLPVGSVAAAGVPAEQVTRQGRYDTHVPKGSWDPDARIEDMKRDGVQGEMIYPTMAMRLFALDDLPFQQACFRAYNDWLKDYCGAHPAQLKGLGLISLGDVEEGVSELKRCREMGLPAAAIAVYRDATGHYGDARFDPFWGAAQDLDLPVSLHVLTDRKPKENRDVSDGIVESQWVQRSLAHMALNGVFERFPKLKVISAEADAGWVPYFEERLDYVFDRRRNFFDFKLSRKTPPSQFIKDSVYFTFMRDKSAITVRHAIGLDKLMWSSDFPHNDSTWPHSQKVIDYLMEGVPASERHQIISGNAAALYGFE